MLLACLPDGMWLTIDVTTHRAACGSRVLGLDTAEGGKREGGRNKGHVGVVGWQAGARHADRQESKQAIIRLTGEGGMESWEVACLMLAWPKPPLSLSCG